MNWGVAIIGVIWLGLLTILQIWKAIIPEKAAASRRLTLLLIILAFIGGSVDFLYFAYVKPSKAQELHNKKVERDEIATAVVARLNSQNSEMASDPERLRQQKRIVINGLERARTDSPEKTLDILTKEETALSKKVVTDINDLIERNKEIAVFARSEGRFEIALKAVNTILKYAPSDSFALRERGCVNYELGNVEICEKDILRSVDVAETRLEKASALISAGIFYSQICEYQKAQSFFEAAHQIGKQDGNSLIIAASSLDLATMCERVLGIEQTLEYMAEAIFEFEKSENKLGSICAQCNLATLYLKQGKIQEARIKLTELENQAEAEHDNNLKSPLFSNIGILYIKMGDYLNAEKYILSAIELSKKIGTEDSIATDYGNLGIIYRKRGEILKAELEQNKALVLHKKFANYSGICRDLFNLGNLSLDSNNYEQAAKRFSEGMDIAKKFNLKDYKAQGHANVAILYMEQNNFDAAEFNLTLCVTEFDKLNDLYDEACALFNLASIFKERGDKGKAAQIWNQSRDIFKEIGLPHMVEQIDIQLEKLKGIYNSDPNKVYEYFVTTTKCRIPDGMRMDCLKSDLFPESNSRIDMNSACIHFTNGEKVLGNAFVDRIRGYYEKNPPTKLTPRSDSQGQYSKYGVKIIFPNGTHIVDSAGHIYDIMTAFCVIEITEAISKFTNYETFSMDTNTIAKRAWVKQDDFPFGLILRKDLYKAKNCQIGFEAQNGGTITVTNGKDPCDPIIQLLKIEIKRI